MSPPATRYPLYADSPTGPRPTAPPTVSAPPPSAPPPPLSHHRSARRRPAPWLLWAVLLLAVVIVVGVGIALVLGGGDDTTTAEDPGNHTQPVPSTGSTGPSPSESSAAGEPTSSAPPPSTTRDLASVVRRIQVPGTAASSTDARTGAPVTFEPAHLTDGDPTTCWRVDGDASGSTITVTFAQQVTLTEVGLINGYAKSYPGYDGYRLNRRVLSVRWVFDDGTTVDQQLAMGRRMQTAPVHAGPTAHLQLEILSVSPPGAGPLGKDYTPISELDLTGTTG